MHHKQQAGFPKSLLPLLSHFGSQTALTLIRNSLSPEVHAHAEQLKDILKRIGAKVSLRQIYWLLLKYIASGILTIGHLIQESWERIGDQVYCSTQLVQLKHECFGTRLV